MSPFCHAKLVSAARTSGALSLGPYEALLGPEEHAFTKPLPGPHSGRGARVTCRPWAREGSRVLGSCAPSAKGHAQLETVQSGLRWRFHFRV